MSRLVILGRELVARQVFALSTFLSLIACALGEIAAGQDTKAPPPISAPALGFEDVAKKAGVLFRFETGSRGRHDLPEVMGGGVALFDADGDGRLDIYLCNGGPIEPSPREKDPPCRLYLNRGEWHFEDITDRAGAPGPSYAMGAAAGDYDGDGRIDLLVTGWRDQRLYHNLGGGRFQDVTSRAGLASDQWSTSAAFADLDGDGDPDLYIANYLEYDPVSPPFCAAPDGRRDYCGPEDFRAQADRLYRNNGDGTFTDVTVQAGIDRPEGRGLGVLIAELTGDTLPDIYVANDGTSCWLFANRGHLRFDEVGLASGVARDGLGNPIAAMGVACGDLSADGRSDLVVTNFLGRSTIAFLGQGDGPRIYKDASSRLGLSKSTRDVLGFGIALVDFDGDGCLDLIQTNGHVLDRARLGAPLAMRPTFLRGTDNGFEDRNGAAGDWFGRPVLGRGLAVGDLDGDGRPDVVASSLDAPTALLRNASQSRQFLELDVVDRSGRLAVGASVHVRAGDRRQVALIAAGGSYLSSSSSALFLGLGPADGPDQIEIVWPWGGREIWKSPTRAGMRRLRLQQGTGEASR